jgi:UPF0176 protein
MAPSLERLQMWIVTSLTSNRIRFFEDIEIKVSTGDANTFPRLMVKVRPEIVTLQAGVELKADQDNHLTPAEWKRMLEEESDAVAVDVRNRYESEAGKFENAITCDIEHFRELPAYIDQLGNLKEKKLLIYCTGGIRCEKASALLRQRGFAMSISCMRDHDLPATVRE